MEERKKEVLRVYNRKTVKGQYPNGLAYSVHLSVKENEEECPLHNNYGLVFPKAWVNEDNVIVPSFVGNLKVAAVKKNGAVTYLITGEDWKSDGMECVSGLLAESVDEETLEGRAPLGT